MPSVLIVDDEPNIRRMVGALLAAEGYEVRDAPDGASALTRAVESEPDVLLLDLMMPEMSGWEFREEQLRDEMLRSIPVVVMTASRGFDGEHRGAAADDRAVERWADDSAAS